jgi:xanthine dehydrogenase YagT iron-sulfur-binding subunit
MRRNTPRFPSVTLASCARRELSLIGSTTVIAFCVRWLGSGSREALLAELRGLGATLLVLTPAGGALLGPDDEPEALLPAPQLWKQLGVRSPERGGPCLTVVLLDAHGGVRTRQEIAAAVDIEATLLAALRGAGKAVRAAPRGIGRREVLVASLVSGIGLAVLQACAGAAAPRREAPVPPVAPVATDGLIEISLSVNGEKRTLRIEPRVTLLDALREQLALTGTKKGCDMGQCGACTVLVDGKRIDSCLALAAQQEGREITTIEGLARGDLHPMQAAFLAEDAFQCGYCTPGQILSAIALLNEGRPATDEQIREGMSGNICRCGAYPNIVAAIRSVRG